jgi:glucokinase
MGRAVIGVDLGGTNVRTSIITPGGDVLEKLREPTQAVEGHVKVIERLVRNISRQRETARQRDLQVLGVGVGAPGVIRAAHGVVVRSPNFPDWDNLPLRQELESAVGLPVSIENDANAAALGEHWLGAGKGIGSMIFLTLGTGVGGGIVLNGRIWQGADGMAGEVGHMTIRPDGRRCGCGNRGCLEMYASSRGIVLSYREALAKERPARSAEGLTSADIYQAARDGEPAAIAVMQEMGRALGIGIADLINIFNPEMIVIGGGVKDAWPLFIEAARDEVRKRAFDYPASRTQIVPSVLGDDAGMIGAAAVALQKAAA